MAETRSTSFRPVKLSLRDLVGEEYADAVCGARAAVAGESRKDVEDRLSAKVDFYPEELHSRLVRLLAKVGREVCPPARASAGGATTSAFAAAAKTGAAPLSGLGYFRVGEDGRLYLVTKSEHYHAPLGHAFPGYRLIETARALGIPNATHNNTRGHLTRLLEEELVRAANGIAPGDDGTLADTIASAGPTVLNRVLNLETGSLAVEAAVKMALATFYRVQADSPRPKHRGRIPVMVVIGDDDGGEEANYHGTTLVAQAMRGMWPELRSALEEGEVMLVRSVPPNDTERLESVFRQYDVPEHGAGRYRIAAFLHELVLMNYGARTLTRGFIRRAYDLCRERDVPTVDDEIQSCIWSPDLFLYKEYGIEPTFVVLGKGFPGGEYPASRVIFSSRMDNLPQFGALVTNGQEELASLAYLITMRWARENAEVTRDVGDYYESRLREVALGRPDLVKAVEGSRHMIGLHFHDLDTARAFAAGLTEAGIDISVQTYKSSCPPAALTKLPLTAGYEVADLVAGLMAEALVKLDA